MDLKELLADNAALVKRLNELGHSSAQSILTSSTKLRDITDPLTWVFCFLSLVAVKSDDPVTKELLAYAQLVIQLVWKHGGLGWQNYDTRFRRKMAAGAAGLSWTLYEQSILAMSIFQSSNEPCSYCYESDHKQADCALVTLDMKTTHQFQPQGHTSSRQAQRPRPYRPYEDICRKYNKGLCSNQACKYDHICNLCFASDHIALSCQSKGKASAHALPKVPSSKAEPSPP